MSSPAARLAAMRNISVLNPVRPISSSTPSTTPCSALVLIRMRYGRVMYRRATAAADERQTGEVADERVTLIGAAVQELELLWQLVVDLEGGGDGEQHEEAEVDQRVHQTGSRIAQQRAHVDAGAEVAGAALDVLGRGLRVGAGRPRSQFFIRSAKRNAHASSTGMTVNASFQRCRDAAEHDTVHGVLVVPVGDQRDDAAGGCEHRHPDADGDGDVMRLEPAALAGVVAVRLSVVRAHDAPNASCSAPRRAIRQLPGTPIQRTTWGNAGAGGGDRVGAGGAGRATWIASIRWPGPRLLGGSCSRSCRCRRRQARLTVPARCAGGVERAGDAPTANGDRLRGAGDVRHDEGLRGASPPTGTLPKSKAVGATVIGNGAVTVTVTVAVSVSPVASWIV